MAIDKIQTYCQSNKHRLAYFYCDFKDSILQTPTNLLGSIIGQLIVQENDLPEIVQSFYNKFRSRREKPSLEELFDLLRNLLYETDGDCRTYIALDALDECDDRTELLDLLRKMQLLSDLKVNFLITSRKESDMEESFCGLPFFSIKEDDIAADVELYVTAEIAKEKKLRTKPVAVKERMKSALVAGAKGM
jgi:hypothetical protein